MASPKISIIIPLYNRAKELADCLESIKKQSFTDYEVIIINDGSTDIPPEQLDKMVKCQMSNVKCLFQPNQGAPVARNRGLAEASGEYVFFCDADVILRPVMLEKMIKVLDENPNASYAYSSFKFGWKKFRLFPFDAERLRRMPYVHTMSLVRREHFPGFDPALKRFQDWDVWLTMLEQGYKGQWVDEVLFCVKNNGTISSWIPSFVAKLGWGRKARQYQEAMDIIKRKHQL